MTNISLFLKELEFLHPNYFWLLLIIIPIIGWRFWQRRKLRASLTVPTVTATAKIPKTWRVYLRWLPDFFRITALAFLVTALAQPQTSFFKNNIEVEGVDIVLALDISSSMKAMDFKPNRLEACKSVAENFINGRPSDRIGLVLYSGEAFTQCPVTSDHQTLLGLLEQTDFDMIEDGTAVGDGLGTAVNRLKESTAKSKIIILLSDGVNNCGYIDPYSAAEIAKNQNIKVYTIGAGTNGEAPFPSPRGPVFMEMEVDEALLASIAETTGGTYFRANDNKKLKEVYEEIDKMEKTILSDIIFENKEEAFFPFLLIGIIALILDIFSKYFILQNRL